MRRRTTMAAVGDEPVVLIDWRGASNYAKS
jgi:hypothetical protein